jgi:cytochrome c-type biogenesis protein CcmH
VSRGLLLAAIVAGLVCAGAAAAGTDRPSALDIEDEIVCPVCSTTLDQSDAPVARQMRSYIRSRIRAGDSKEEIKRQLVADFGESVLAAPPKRGFGLLAWALPLVALGVGVPLVALLTWRWSRGRGAERGGREPPLDPDLERRLDDELARFERA